MTGSRRDDDSGSGTRGEESDQVERARASWELVVHIDRDDEKALERLRRALRFPRSDREALRAMLPGPVRRGARVDLEPVLDQLRSAGVMAKIRHREATHE